MVHCEEAHLQTPEATTSGMMRRRWSWFQRCRRHLADQFNGVFWDIQVEFILPGFLGNPEPIKSEAHNQARQSLRFENDVIGYEHSLAL